MRTFDLQLNLSFGSNSGFLRIVYNDSKEILSVSYYIADWDLNPVKIPAQLFNTTLFEGAYKSMKAAVENNMTSLIESHDQSTLS